MRGNKSSNQLAHWIGYLADIIRNFGLVVFIIYCYHMAYLDSQMNGIQLEKQP